MRRDPGNGVPGVGIVVLGVGAALATASSLIAVLELAGGLDNASSVYLLAVVAIAIWRGAVPAVATAIGAFLAYNLLFVDPRLTLGVTSGGEVLTLLLLLFVGVVIGRLAGRQRDRERAAHQGEEEAQALFRISRDIATSERLGDAMESLVGWLAREAGMARSWIGLGATITHERVVADSAASTTAPLIGTYAILQAGGRGAATWTRIHPAAAASRRVVADASRARMNLYRVEIRAGSEVIGSLWSQRDELAGEPRAKEARLLATAADQLGQAVRRDRLAAQAAEVEIARRSEELKSALVDSVSHDLRTPLATIRAAAGNLGDPAIELGMDERRAAATAIDREAERLNRMVGSLLDASRIQGGALIADVEVIPIDEVVVPAVDRARAAADGRPIDIVLPAETPNVRADASLLDRVVSNLLENAVRHAGPGAAIRVGVAPSEAGTVALVVEDGGPGVPDEALAGLFGRFHSGATGVRGERHGFGLGLAIVDGFVNAMGGTVRAARSGLGGLAIMVVLPSAPAEEGDA